VITLDGHTLDYFGLIPLKGHDNPTPSTRDKSLVIPGKHGSWDFGADMDVIQFNFPMAFNEEDRTAVQKRIREFVSFLLDSKGKPRTFTLAFDYEPEKYYYVRYSGQIKPERLFGLGTFDLPLTAFDPVAYAEQTYKIPEAITGINYDEGNLYPVDPNEIYLSSEIYTFNDPISFNEPYDPNYFYENPTEFTWIYSKHYCGIYNYSHYETPLIVEIEGSVINPRITNQSTGKTLYLPSITNQKMTVDTGKFTVKINEQNKLTGVIGIEDFNFISGDNSLLFEGGLPNATITYKWKHKFM
jgi:phage-related protein